jgi:mRNA interferase RelE/StbE
LVWRIEFEQDAIRQLNRLDRSIRRRIVEYLELRVVASADPRNFGKPLRGAKTGLWSYRWVPTGSFASLRIADR